MIYLLMFIKWGFGEGALRFYIYGVRECKTCFIDLCSLLLNWWRPGWMARHARMQLSWMKIWWCGLAGSWRCGEIGNKSISANTIPWFIMPWLLAVPGHQQPRCWPVWMYMYLSSTCKDFNYLYHLMFREMIESTNIFVCSFNSLRPSDA